MPSRVSRLDRSLRVKTPSDPAARSPDRRETKGSGDEAPRPFFSGSVEPEQVRRLLTLIDERLRLRAAVARPPLASTDASAETEDESGELPNPVSDSALNLVAEGLDHLAAPLFNVQRAGRVARLGRALLNLPLRIFGRPQQHFNSVLRQQAKSWAELLRASFHLQSILMHQLAEQRQLTHRLSRREEDLAAAVESLRRSLIEAPARGARPVIVDTDAYRRLCESMPDGLRVMLGAEDSRPGWLKVDCHASPGAIVVADATNLPFPPGSVAELVAAGAVECFPRRELVERVLPYWHALLRPGGELRIIALDWRRALEMHAAGQLDLETLHQVTFGRAEHGAGAHRAMYDGGTLIALLQSAGFDRCEVVEERRDDRGGPRMEVVARRPT